MGKSSGEKVRQKSAVKKYGIKSSEKRYGKKEGGKPGFACGHPLLGDFQYPCYLYDCTTTIVREKCGKK